MADNIANIIIDCGGDERVLQIGNFYNFTSPYFHILGKLINYDPDHFSFLTGDPAGIEIEHMLPNGQLVRTWLAADMLDSCDAATQPPNWPVVDNSNTESMTSNTEPTTSNTESMTANDKNKAINKNKKPPLYARDPKRIQAEKKDREDERFTRFRRKRTKSLGGFLRKRRKRTHKRRRKRRKTRKKRRKTRQKKRRRRRKRRRTRR